MSQNLSHGPLANQSFTFIGDRLKRGFLEHTSAKHPNGTETDLLSNLHEIEHPSSFVPYVQIKDDRDTREDLILQINSDPKETATDLLSNQPEDEQDNHYESFVQIEDDRDNGSVGGLAHIYAQRGS